MGNKCLQERRLKRQIGNQQKQSELLPKGQICKKVSVKHCINIHQAHSKFSLLCPLDSLTSLNSIKFVVL